MRIALPILLLVASLAAAADGVSLAIPAKGDAAFTVTAPAGWTVAAGMHSTTLIPAEKRPHIQVWSVEQPDVAAAAGTVATLITDEVKDFVASETKDVTIAGKPAKLLIGTGTEADDGDPSNAQVTVFTVAGKVWLLVSHGEGAGTADRAPAVAALLQTVK